MILVGLIISSIIIILIDLPRLLKKDQRIRVVSLYFFLLATGFIISLLQIIDESPTNPTVITRKIVRSILGG
ncbi:hypothetical protein JCM16358_04730 [Halanaerocella petrolearia]